MVRPILRSLFQRLGRGVRSPGGQMFMAGTAPVWIDALTDPGSALDVDITETISTDLSNVAENTKQDQTPEKPPSDSKVNKVAKEDAESTEAENTESLTSNVVADDAGEASTSTANDAEIADYIDNDSVKRINNYKDIIRKFLGDSSGGDKLQQVALLL